MLFFHVTQYGRWLTISSTEKDIATVQAADADDIDKAVKAAKAALNADSWKKLPASDRGQLMAKLADLIEEKKELLATIDAVSFEFQPLPMHHLLTFHSGTMVRVSPDFDFL